MNWKWLRNEGGVMFCQVCKEEGNTASARVSEKIINFVKSTANFKLHTLKDYGVSKLHR